MPHKLRGASPAASGPVPPAPCLGPRPNRGGSKWVWTSTTGALSTSATTARRTSAAARISPSPVAARVSEALSNPLFFGCQTLNVVEPAFEFFEYHLLPRVVLPECILYPE